MIKIDRNELEKAQKELGMFLDEYPHMKKYQEEIDRVLDASTDRLETIGIMLAGKFFDLHCHMQELFYSRDESSHDFTLSKAA